MIKSRVWAINNVNHRRGCYKTSEKIASQNLVTILFLRVTPNDPQLCYAIEEIKFFYHHCIENLGKLLL